MLETVYFDNDGKGGTDVRVSLATKEAASPMNLCPVLLIGKRFIRIINEKSI
jgi:hypothetical protein